MSIDKTYKELLNKLANGSISDKEKWQLEKASLDDPFLADALEGYYDNKERPHRLTELEKRLQPTTKTKTRLFPLRWLSIAASLLILLGASFWLFNNSHELGQQSQEVAVSQDVSTNRNKEWVATSSEASKTYVDQAGDILGEESLEQLGRKVSKSAPVSASKTGSVGKVVVTETAEAVREKVSEVYKSKAQDKDEEETSVVVTENELDQADLLDDKVRRGNASPEVFKSSKQPSPAIEDQSEESSEEEVLVADKSMSKKKSKASPSYIEISSEKKESVELTEYEAADAAVSQHNASPPPRSPRIIQGIVTNERGIPMPGVQVLDTKKNELTTTDARGNFILPELNGYIITAFAGYDSMTVALAPELDIQLRESSESLSQPLKRLVDVLNDTDLKTHYKEQLNSLFSRYWPICKTGWQDAYNNNPHSISINLVIDDNGRLDDVHYFRDLSEPCRNKVDEILQEAQGTIFKTERPISFTFRVNL